MKLTTLIGVISISFTACATDNTSTERPSRARAASILTAATSALGSAKSDALDSSQLTAPDVLDVSYTSPCDLGGHFDFAGTYEFNRDDPAATWDLDIQFLACAYREATFDGDLRWNQRVNTTGDILERITGTLSLAVPEGDLSCAFDLTIETAATGASSYHGTVCGYDVESELSVDLADVDPEA